MPRTNVNNTDRIIRNFNNRIRGELSRRKLKQKDLADYLNVSQPIISLRMRDLAEWPFRDMLETCDYFGETFKEETWTDLTS